MKENSASNIFCTASLLLLIVVCPILVKAQEKRFNLIISGQLSHFTGKGQQISDESVEYYAYPIDPGIESLFGIHLGKKNLILSGVNYYSGKFTTDDIDENGVEYRLKFKEFCFPFLLRGNLKKEFFITAGVYPGWVKKGHFETTTSWSEWTIAPWAAERYNDETFILDLYFDLGKYLTVTKNQGIMFSPFIKYKLNDYWMGQFRSKLHYGIKLSYSLDF